MAPLALNPSIQLRLLIVDSDDDAAGRLSGALTKLRVTLGQSIDSASVASVKQAYEALEDLQPNTIIVDLLSTGLRDSVTFVQHIRAFHPATVIVLYCEERELTRREAEVYTGWGERLRHYFLLPKETPDAAFEDALRFNLVRVQLDLCAYGTQDTLARTGSTESGTLTDVQISKLQSQVALMARQLQEIAVGQTPGQRPQPPPPRRAFVIMSLVDDMRDVYEVGMKEFLAQQFGVSTFRMDEVYPDGLIIQRIYAEIHRSAVVLAELTHPRPNCFYELGFADALGKPIVRLARKGTELPFDVNQYPFVLYDSVVDLRSRLGNALRDLDFPEGIGRHAN